MPAKKTPVKVQKTKDEVVVTVNMPRELHARATDFADNCDLSLSQLIRRAIREMIDRDVPPKL